MEGWLFEARISPEAVGLPPENVTMCVGLNANEIISVVCEMAPNLVFILVV